MRARTVMMTQVTVVTKATIVTLVTVVTVMTLLRVVSQVTDGAFVKVVILNCRVSISDKSFRVFILDNNCRVSISQQRFGNMSTLDKD